jgi:hypothetical protein
MNAEVKIRYPISHSLFLSYSGSRVGENMGGGKKKKKKKKKSDRERKSWLHIGIGFSRYVPFAYS